MSIKLRELIRQVRACKTASEERSVISRESAMIRTAIKEEQDQFRHRNVAKLLFMHMLGYPTHFGQLECLKLIASPHFPEKRIGYLGLMLLLSEEADVLMLATNSLKQDLNHKNQYIVGLALCTIGNLATPDMSRDLATEVDKHLRAGSPYLRKKAALAMARCLTKVPDMVEDFVERIVTLLKDRTHGVLITAVQLMIRVCEIDPEIGKSAFSRLVPSLVRQLRNLLSMGYSPEHDVSGISDPFLQVSILSLLRILGTNNEETSEAMNDILAQVATNTETSKNAGNAILYECVQTIMTVEAGDDLRVLAINILGRFLLNRDNNIRYVALNTLKKVISQDAAAVQRHRNTIVDCLKDPDVSIRQRALELIYRLVNMENVQGLTAELLNYLVVCPVEHRAEICSRVLKVVDSFSPDPRWRVDTLITMLTIAGKECADKVLAAIIVYVSSSSEDLRGYATHKLLKAVRDDDGEQLGLLVVGIWCIGEYGDMLLSPYSFEGTEAGGVSYSVKFEASDPLTIIDLVNKCATRVIANESIKARALTCFAKLTERFKGCDPAVIAKLKSLIKNYDSSMSLELQLRSCEYGVLVNGNAHNSSALARMPVVDSKAIAAKRSTSVAGFSMGGDAMGGLEGDLLSGGGGDSTMTNGGGDAKSFAPVSNGGGGDSLLDLDDIFGGGGGSSTVPATSSPIPMTSSLTSSLTQQQPVQADNLAGNTAQTSPAPANDADLLSDIFSAPAATQQQPTPQPPLQPQQLQQQQQQPPPLPPQQTIDPFAAPMQTTTTTAAPSDNRFSAYAKDGLNIDFTCVKSDPTNIQKASCTAIFTNSTNTDMTSLVFQAAVPKYIQMEMLPPSGTTVPGSNGGEVRQTINVVNTMCGTKALMFKLKIKYTAGGKVVEDMLTCNSFPAGF